MSEVRARKTTVNSSEMGQTNKISDDISIISGFTMTYFPASHHVQ